MGSSAVLLQYYCTDGTKWGGLLGDSSVADGLRRWLVKLADVVQSFLDRKQTGSGKKENDMVE